VFTWKEKHVQQFWLEMKQLEEKSNGLWRFGILNSNNTIFYNENLDIEFYTTIITRICICVFF
jgi:hypothetical protein